MIKIRKGVFETNSSSVHSLCISKEDKLFLFIPKTKSIKIRTNEFGWEAEEYTSAEDKLSYIYTGILQHIIWDVESKHCKSKEEVANIINKNKYYKKFINYLDQIYSNVDIENIKIITTKEAWFDGGSNNEYTFEFFHEINGGINLEVLDYIFKSIETFINFAENPNTVIRTGNDNDESYDFVVEHRDDSDKIFMIIN